MEIRMFKKPEIASDCFYKIFVPYFLSESPLVKVKTKSDGAHILNADVDIFYLKDVYKEKVDIEIRCCSALITVRFDLDEKDAITDISFKEIELIKNIEKFYNDLKEMAKTFEEEYVKE